MPLLRISTTAREVPASWSYAKPSPTWRGRLRLTAAISKPSAEHSGARRIHPYREFEGPGYQRVVTTVHRPEGDVTGSIYVLAAAETTE